MNDKSVGKLEAWREVVTWAAAQDRKYAAQNYSGSISMLLRDLVGEMERLIVQEVKRT